MFCPPTEQRRDVLAVESLDVAQHACAVCVAQFRVCQQKVLHVLQAVEENGTDPAHQGDGAGVAVQHHLFVVADVHWQVVVVAVVVAALLAVMLVLRVGCLVC